MMDRVRLWEAVLLSFDVDPVTPSPVLTERLDAKLFAIENELWFSRKKEQPIHEWLELALSSLGASLPFNGKEGGIESRVKLEDYARWAEKKGFQLPEGFPRALANESQEKESDSQVKYRSALKTILALAKLAQVDLEHPYAAADTILAAVHELGSKISRNTIVGQIADAKRIRDPTTE